MNRILFVNFLTLVLWQMIQCILVDNSRSLVLQTKDQKQLYRRLDKQLS